MRVNYQTNACTFEFSCKGATGGVVSLTVSLQITLPLSISMTSAFTLISDMLYLHQQGRAIFLALPQPRKLSNFRGEDSGGTVARSVEKKEQITLLDFSVIITSMMCHLDEKSHLRHDLRPSVPISRINGVSYERLHSAAFA
jgi:hypothetical protein